MSEGIRSTSFTLVDENDMPIASFASYDGKPNFLMFDKTGVKRLGISLTEAGEAVILINGKDGTNRIAICGSEAHGPFVDLHDKNGKPRLMITFDEQANEPVIGIFDIDGRGGKVMLKLDGQGNPSIVGSDAMGLKIFDGS